MIVRKGHKRPKTRLTFTAKTAGAGICASGGGSSGLWFDTQSTTATAAPATSDCETAYGSGASDSEFDGDWLGIKPKVPKANEADYGDVKALEAACDFDWGSEVAACAAACSRPAFTFEKSCGDGIVAAEFSTAKARRYYRRLCGAIAKMHRADAEEEEHHPPMVQKDVQDAFPTMPVTSVTRPPPHRQKIGPHQWLVNACVARPVGKAEIALEPKAREALDKEWDLLKGKTVWDLDPDGVFEWRDVAAKARREGREVHFGMLHELCFEKGSELPPSSENIRGEWSSWETRLRTRIGK